MDILKLILKKEIFEQVQNKKVSSLTFEMTPFYLSRFTTSKYNTIDNLKKDKSLFKKFDKIQFTCAAESVEFDVKDIVLTEDNGETKFLVKFLTDVNIDTQKNEEIQPVVEEQEEQIEEILNKESLNVEPVVKKVEEQNDDLQIQPVVEEQEKQVQIEETIQDNKKTPLDDNDLKKLLSHKNVFGIKSRIVRIGYMGNVWGVNGKKLPIHNEHEQLLTLEKLVLPLDKMIEKLKEYIKSGYVFIDIDNIKITNTEVELYIKHVNRFDTINWL